MDVQTVSHALHILRIAPQMAGQLAARVFVVAVYQVGPPVVCRYWSVVGLADIQCAILHIAALVAAMLGRAALAQW